MTKPTEATTPGLRARPGKYLTFLLGDESYGLPVLKVREIIRLVEITPVPQMPTYIKGLINLRGKLVPVIDLRIRFALHPREFTESTCIVVVEVNTASGGASHIGFIVDGVEEVHTLVQDNIEKTPNFGTKLGTEYLLGMANVREKVTALLDIDRVVDQASLERIDEAAA
jgi:purine-binding chemotaxis protein CheW